MVQVICLVATTTMAILSGILTIWQVIRTFRHKEGKKAIKGVLLFASAAAVSLVLAVITYPKAETVFDDYEAYQAEAVERQVEDEQNFMLAQEFVRDGNLLEAIRHLQKISSRYEEYGEATNLLSDCIKKFKENVINEAESLSNEGKYSEAINVIQTGRFLLPDDSDFAIKLEKYTTDLSKNVIETATTAAENYIAEGDYQSAIITIQEALKECPESQELKLKKNTYENQFIKQISATAAEYVSAHKIDAAVDLLNDALSILPNNRDFKEKLEICKSIPVSLSTLT